ncbi:ABC transporter, permease protein EscB [Bacillus methanolicus PB1]|uniref:ABC transporter, permease protein EscB n=1 Tax=Bacillus methanolicus PB1 TaxID=997296 RepID=I3E634_BACMT|nr:ABC transporter permease [Bacillus methanolicus]EIJ81955.1 ABC transporter, permease protein EscB [Bacillus methanolicus PB1]
MFNAEKLWKERAVRTIKELSRYLRYILNGHLVVVFLFLLGTAAYYYQEWLKTLTPDFPAVFLMAAIIAIFLTYSPIYTFLLEADGIFLLPLENKLSRYFKRSIIASFIVQAYLLIIVLAVFMPMYVQVNKSQFQTFFYFLMMLVIVKSWNLAVRWHIQYYVEKNVHFIDSCIRYCINAVFLFLLFSNANNLFLVLIFAVMGILYVYFRSQTKIKGLKWEYLIDLEERRMTSFYRIANLFTDVPKLKDRVKRRKWLDWMVNRVEFQHSKTFTHLYVRTFFRAGDYFGLFIRLTLIGAVGLYLISFGFGQIVIVLLFLYLTGFQLLPLWNHHQKILWVNLYPVKDEFKVKSFHRLLLMILLIQSVVFSLILLLKGEWAEALAALAAGISFTYYFVFIYSKKRLQN